MYVFYTKYQNFYLKLFQSYEFLKLDKIAVLKLTTPIGTKKILSCDRNFDRAAVGMGIPTGIPMGMGMGWYIPGEPKKIPPATFVDITAMHGNFCTKFYTIVKRSNIHFITKFY